MPARMKRSTKKRRLLMNVGPISRRGEMLVHQFFRQVLRELSIYTVRLIRKLPEADRLEMMHAMTQIFLNSCEDERWFPPAK